MITPITSTVYGNEKAYYYRELIKQSPKLGNRRYRLIVVNRDGNLTEYWEDMGSSKKWKGVKQLNIPSLWEHTVDELRNLADELRHETEIDLHELLQLDHFKLA